mmetsp:Transcript_122736/g.212852  ORF Transcript_122736/g.212852 Transcript_122736/m.212852 type:complete len:99 (+) Transcript_122736:51-347(+)
MWDKRSQPYDYQKMSLYHCSPFSGLMGNAKQLPQLPPHTPFLICTSIPTSPARSTPNQSLTNPERRHMLHIGEGLDVCDYSTIMRKQLGMVVQSHAWH